MIFIYIIRQRLEKKREINNYFKELSYSRIPNRTKFPNGIFSTSFNKNSSPPVSYSQFKIVKAIMFDLPYALEGIFETSSSKILIFYT